MKASENWLREWVHIKLNSTKLAHILTLAGFEVEEVKPAGSSFAKIVTGKIIAVKKAPNGKTSCQVKIGKELLSIICGAPNAIVGNIVPVALEGAEVSGKKVINTHYGELVSEGMLCSGAELGLNDNKDALYVFPQDTKLGVALYKILQLKDQVFDISITPNRGDCLSINGMSREIAAITEATFTPIHVKTNKPKSRESLAVNVSAKLQCPRYLGRVISKVDATIVTPIWIQERLRRSGVRSINIIVDIMNYVMLELGQPLHAFDKDKIGKKITVRLAKPKEQATLLDGNEYQLDAQSLVIADENKVLALAGVMGGLDSSISSNTQNVFLESAYFEPMTIAKTKQLYQIQSDAAYRYERGVDSNLPLAAMERATELLVSLCAGIPGPIIEKKSKQYLPKKTTLKLNIDHVNTLLGTELNLMAVERILKRLYFRTRKISKHDLEVTVPSFRFDISRTVDLIEEVARLYGYDNIPVEPLVKELNPSKLNIIDRNLKVIKDMMVFTGFREVKTYSFIDEISSRLFSPDEELIRLANPVNSDLSIMRPSLVPSLLKAIAYNAHRQQQHLKLFEMASIYKRDEKSRYSEETRLAMVITGEASPEQWGLSKRQVDFYDLKGQVQALVDRVTPDSELNFNSCSHSFLHEGQSASVVLNNLSIGYMGKLHPQILDHFGIKQEVFALEIDLQPLLVKKMIRFNPISKFPEIRRNIALIVNQTVPAKKIQDTIIKTAGSWLNDVFIFDVYQGKGIPAGQKSIAAAIIWQHPERTLRDEEVAKWMESVMQALKEHIGAELRS